MSCRRQPSTRQVEAWIGKLLTSAPRAVRLQKRLIRQWEDLPLSGAIAAGIDAFAAAYETDEPRVTMRKFLARTEGTQRRPAESLRRSSA